MSKQSFTTGQVLTAAQVNSLQANDYNQSVSVKTATYTLAAADKGTRIEFNTSGSVTCTVNSGLFDAGDTLVIQNRGAGAATVTAGTATVNTSASLVVKQYDSGVLYFVSDSSAIYFASDAADTPLTTKGDLFTFSTVADRLAVGNPGETLVADSSTTTGLRWQTAANSNALINGAFEIWQRNTSVAGSSTNFTADRWQAYRAVAGSTFSRQNTSDTTNLPFIQYCVRVQRDSGNTATNGIYLGQNLESATSRRFAGQAVVISFYARKGADFSGASSGLNIQVKSGTGTDQNIFSGLTGEASVIDQTATLTTTWQRFQYTATVSASATQLAVFAQYAPVGTASTNDYFEITGIQLELGSVATGFKRSGGTLAGELAACQRYYYRITSTASYGILGRGYASDANSFQVIVPLKTTMRVTPTALDTSATSTFYYEGGVSGNTPTSVTLGSNGNPNEAQVIVTKASTFTAGQGQGLYGNNNTAAYIGLSAEL